MTEFLEQQVQPVVVLHYSTQRQLSASNSTVLKSTSNTTNNGNNTDSAYLTEFQISQYQVCNMIAFHKIHFFNLQYLFLYRFVFGPDLSWYSWFCRPFAPSSIWKLFLIAYCLPSSKVSVPLKMTE